MYFSRFVAIGLLMAALCLAAPVVAEGDLAIPREPGFQGAALVTANEGHATLRWSMPEEIDSERSRPTYELEQSRASSFADGRLRYAGPAQSMFVSGLLEGRNYFRVRALSSGTTPGPWSDPLVVEVSYPGRGQVLSLLAVGCLVFVATVAAIVTGRLRYRQRPPAADPAGE